MIVVDYYAGGTPVYVTNLTATLTQSVPGVSLTQTGPGVYDFSVSESTVVGSTAQVVAVFEQNGTMYTDTINYVFTDSGGVNPG